MFIELARGHVQCFNRSTKNLSKNLTAWQLKPTRLMTHYRAL